MATGTTQRWRRLRETVVVACATLAPIAEDVQVEGPPSYREFLQTFGAGTFDDFLSVFPPAHMQRWDARMRTLLAPEEIPAALRDLVLFAEDVNGTFFAYRGARIYVLRGFDRKKAPGDLAAVLEHELATDAERLGHWFLPHGPYLLAHAEGMLKGGYDALAFDAWTRALVDQEDARILLRKESTEQDWRVREVYLPRIEGVMRLQAVAGGRCSFRLHLPSATDAKAVVAGLVEDAPPPVAAFGTFVERHCRIDARGIEAGSET